MMAGMVPRMSNDMKRLLNRMTISAAVVAAVVGILTVCHYFLLLKPSLEGKCGGRTLSDSSPASPHITRLRGQVVGKNLSIIQYRWLRRRFTPVGTTLSVVKH